MFYIQYTNKISKMSSSYSKGLSWSYCTVPCMLEINITKTLSVERGPAKEKRNHHSNWNISLWINIILNWLNLLRKMPIRMMATFWTKMSYKIMYARSLTSFLTCDFYPFSGFTSKGRSVFIKVTDPSVAKKGFLTKNEG